MSDFCIFIFSKLFGYKVFSVLTFQFLLMLLDFYRKTKIYRLEIAANIGEATSSICDRLENALSCMAFRTSDKSYLQKIEKLPIISAKILLEKDESSPINLNKIEIDVNKSLFIIKSAIFKLKFLKPNLVCKLEDFNKLAVRLINRIHSSKREDICLELRNKATIDSEEMLQMLRKKADEISLEISAYVNIRLRKP